MTLDRFRKPFLLLLVIGVVSAFTAQAQAMCVYNDMDTAIDVRFYCGFACENFWTVSPSDQACRPGTSGTVQVGWRQDAYGEYWLAEVDVDAHGYAVLYNVNAGSRQVCAYHSDDSLDHCVGFTYTASASPLSRGLALFDPRRDYAL